MQSFTYELVQELRDRGFSGTRWEDSVKNDLLFWKVCEGIHANDFLLAEITKPNLNVLLEIGYALAVGRQPVLLQDKNLRSWKRDLLTTLESCFYTTRQNICDHLVKWRSSSAGVQDPMRRLPFLDNMGIYDLEEIQGTVYHLKPKVSTDWISRIDKSFRNSSFKIVSMDPSVNVYDEFYTQAREIQLASLIVSSFVSTDHIDSEEKNAKVALLTGFSIGLGKHVLVLQQEPSAEILDLGSVACQFEAEDQLQVIIDAWIKKQGQIVATQAPRTNAPIGEPSDPIATITATPEPSATPPRSRGLLHSDSVASDREVLITFYNSTGGANWKNRTNWLSDKPMGEWFGVTTNEDGRVTKLHLRGNSLSGGIPAKLGGLSQLQYLGLEINNLSGTIPQRLSNLSQLRVLDLYQNQLSGSIPPQLGKLASLQCLQLHHNALSGSIPPELGNLTKLTNFSIPQNQLSGSIPSELGKLTRVDMIQLSQNNLSGPIPAYLGDLTQLETLGLRDNNLSGEIPKELGNLRKLRYLYLANNNLSGCIPSRLYTVHESDLSETGLPICEEANQPPSSEGDVQSMPADPQMNEYNTVSEDVKESGLMSCLPSPFYYQYRLLLDEMMRLADQDGGREFSVTHLQLADRIGIDRQLEQNTRIDTIVRMVREVIRVGLVESVSADTPNRYQFPTRHRLTQIAKDLEEKKIHLPPVHNQFRKR